MMLAGVFSSMMVAGRLRYALRYPVLTASRKIVVCVRVLFPEAGEIHPTELWRLLSVTPTDTFTSPITSILIAV